MFEMTYSSVAVLFASRTDGGTLFGASHIPRRIQAAIEAPTDTARVTERISGKLYTLADGNGPDLTLAGFTNLKRAVADGRLVTTLRSKDSEAGGVTAVVIPFTYALPYEARGLANKAWSEFYAALTGTPSPYRKHLTLHTVGDLDTVLGSDGVLRWEVGRAHEWSDYVASLESRLDDPTD